MGNAPTEASYGQVAVGLGLVTQARVDECLQIQQKMRELGVESPLGEILSKKGYLTAQQQTAVLKKIGVQTSPIPGYAILGKIGQGGMGVVYKAMQTSVHRTVAIKILSNSATQDKSYVSRFLQEAQSAASLSHKNLITAIDVGFSNGLYYFVMEFVNGKSCRELLNTKGAFDEKLALDIAQQMTEVLEHIHAHRMVHRDIKPENILLTPEGVVKLCDFGLAKSTISMEQSLTQEGLAVGTPYFMSPEQIRGDKDVDIRADLYSLGATLFCMVLGRPPFSGKSAAETLTMHLSAAVPELRKVAPGTSDDLSAVVQKLMAKDRAHRYQEPRELLDDLLKIREGSAPHHARQHAARLHATHRTHVSRRFMTRRSKTIGPFIGIGAAAAAAVLFLMFMPSPASPTPQPRVAGAPKPEPVPSVLVKPEPTKDDPVKAAEAGRLFAAADQLLKQERWAEAIHELKKLQGQFGGLEYTKGRMTDIGEMTGICSAKLNAATEARDRAVDDTRSALAEGRWKDAQAKLQELVKGGRKDLQRDLDLATAELEAETLLAEIRAARDAKRWIEVQSKVRQGEQRHPQAQAIAKNRAELADAAARAALEHKVGELLSKGSAAAAAAKWSEVSASLVEIAKWKDSDCYRAREAEVMTLREQWTKANAKEAEAEARADWVTAIKDYTLAFSERRYDAAAATLEAYAREHGATREAAAHDADVKARVALAAGQKQGDRNADAKKLFATIGDQMRKQSYEAAMEGIAQLTAEYSDTSHVKSSTVDRTLRQWRALIEASGRVGSHILVELDFEDHPGLWRPGGGGSAQNADDPHSGRRAARLMLPSGARATHPIVNLPARSDSISFWTRARGRAPGVKYRFVLYDPGRDAAHFGADFTATLEWKRESFRLSELKPLNPAATKQGTLDPTKVAWLMIVNGGGSGGDGVEIQFDTLRVEALRGN